LAGPLEKRLLERKTTHDPDCVGANVMGCTRGFRFGRLVKWMYGRIASLVTRPFVACRAPQLSVNNARTIVKRDECMFVRLAQTTSDEKSDGRVHRFDGDGAHMSVFGRRDMRWL
jgi:hypothetical protein